MIRIRYVWMRVFFFLENGGYVWTVPKSMNLCCVWIQQIILLTTSLVKAKKILIMHFNHTTTQRVIIINRKKIPNLRNKLKYILVICIFRL